MVSTSYTIECFVVLQYNTWYNNNINNYYQLNILFYWKCIVQGVQRGFRWTSGEFSGFGGLP